MQYQLYNKDVMAGCSKYQDWQNGSCTYKLHCSLLFNVGGCISRSETNLCARLCNRKWHCQSL